MPDFVAMGMQVIEAPNAQKLRLRLVRFSS